METVQHYRAMEAFCRQRAKMDGEDERFWLAEAERLAKLIAAGHGIRTTQPNGKKVSNAGP
jgi:hypothetical protein